MSTRSYICSKQEDGTYKGVYCHHDGYLQYVGAILLDHYNNNAKIEELLKLGDLDVLAEKLYPDINQSHTIFNKQSDVCFAYGRDGGEKNREAIYFDLQDLKNSDMDYVYLFENGKWQYLEPNKFNFEIKDVEEELCSFWKDNGFDERPIGIYGDFIEDKDFAFVRIALENRKEQIQNTTNIEETKTFQKSVLNAIDKPSDTKKTGWERVNEDRQALIDKIKVEIEKGNLTWHHYLVGHEIPFNGSTEKDYNGMNRLYLAFSAANKGFEDPRWYTYKQAQELNLQVKKGERGTKIEKITVYDQKLKREIKSSKDLDAITKDMLEEEKQAYISENVKSYYNQYVVFNGEQIEGLNKYVASRLNDEEKNSTCEHILQNSFVPIEYVDTNVASYIVSQDKVNLPNRDKFVSMDEFYTAAFHELAHASGAESRLNRKVDNHNQKSYAKEEVTAEMASLFLQQALGVELKDVSIKNSAAYIQNWNAILAEPREFVKAIKDAEKASTFILKGTKEKNKENVEVKDNKENIETKDNNKNMLSPQEYYAQKNAKKLDDIVKNVPAEMKALNNWCAFKTYYDKESGKKKKFILSAETGSWAKCNESATWTSFDKALAFAREQNCEGLSFALNPNDGITCIDLDHCIGDKGMRSQLCWDVLNASDKTYAEKSASGKGVHVFFKAQGVTDGFNLKNDEKGIECYDRAKFISMTGNLISKSNELRPATEKLVALVHKELGEKKQLVSQARMTFDNYGFKQLSTSEVIETIKRSKVGNDFKDLMNGVNLMNDLSRSDAKLLGIIGFFTNYNESQMKDIFMTSGLYRPNKGEQYIDRTISYIKRTAVIAPTKLGKSHQAQKTRAKGKGK